MRPLSVGRAWDEAKAALQAHRKLIVPVALGLVLLPAVVMSMIEPRAAAGQQPPAGPWMLGALAMVIVMLIGELAIVLLVNGWRGSVGGAIGKAARRTPTFILGALCYLVPVLLLFSLIMAVSGVGTSPTGQIDWSNFHPTGWLLMLAGIAALVYVSVRLLPLLAVAACEDVGPIQALKRSFVLTSGHFWRLLGFLLMLVLAFLIVAAAIGALVGTAVTLVLGEPEPWSLSLLLIALAGGLVQAGFVMVYTAMLARIYAQLTAPVATVPEVSREAD
ncbi:MAG TPA: glycerophosphoryl diester phosphodiesterase membrane domain-containing protein [Sphingomicrobium sp.]